MKLNWIERLLYYLNWLLILLLLGSYGARYISPETFWPVAFLGLGYPFLLAANLMLAIWWSIRKKWIAIYPIVAILLGWSQLTGFCQVGWSSEGTPETHLKLLSYNVKNFDRYSADMGIKNKSGIFKIIREEKPDVICFQEYYSATGEHKNTRAIKDMGYPHVYFEKFFTGRGNQQWGIAVFSKYKIQNEGAIHFTNQASNNNGIIYTDLKIKDQIWRVYNVHLQSINFEREDYQYVQEINNQPKEKENIASLRKIASKLKRAFQKRAVQAKELKAAISQSPYPIILCGDFNDTPQSYTYYQILEGLKDAYKEGGSGFEGTYVGPLPSFRIDYILLSESLQATHYYSINQEFSDHYPIVCEIELP